MNGRLEQENKTFLLIEQKLKDMPDFVYDWYINLRASDNSAKTCRDYITKIYKFLYSINPNVQSVSLHDISYNNVSKYFISIKTKNKDGIIENTSDSYQQTIWCCLNNFFSFLRNQDYININYMESIKKPKNKDLTRINENRILLTKKDFNKILSSVLNGSGSHKAKCFQENMKNRDMAIMLIFVSTGIRKSALSEINMDNINFDDHTLFILDKGDIWHKYKLTDDTMNYINKWVVDRKKINQYNSNALFLSYQGLRMSGNAIYNLVEKYCYNALGYNISPHKLRSGFCSVMYKETKDIEKVRRMVGHANVATTQRYIVTGKEESEEAARIMSNIIKL